MSVKHSQISVLISVSADFPASFPPDFLVTVLIE